MKRTTFILVLTSIISLKGTGCQNAKITVVPATLSLGDSVEMTCSYIGPSNVSSVLWFNGSHSADPLILTPVAEDIPECDKSHTDKTLLDLSRISYTCDVAKNSYTLRINPVMAQDDKIMLSCTFQDPLPHDKHAEYIINLRGTSEGSQEDGSVLLSPTAFAVIGVVTVLLVSLLLYWQCRRKRETTDKKTPESVPMTRLRGTLNKKIPERVPMRKFRETSVKKRQEIDHVRKTKGSDTKHVYHGAFT